MLIQPDRHELGDKRLDPKEGVAQKREQCIAMAGTKRLANQDDLEDPSRILGPRIQFGDMVAKIQRIAPEVRVLDGLLGNVALYAPRNRKEVDDARPQWEQEQVDRLLRCQARQNPFFLYYKYVGGFPKTPLHEFSGLITEEYTRLANKEIRGWRTVLMMLLEQGLVSYRAVVKEFGDVGSDRRGWRWLEATRKWRNNPEVKFATEKGE